MISSFGREAKSGVTNVSPLLEYPEAVVIVLASSPASRIVAPPLPQGFVPSTKILYTLINCGSEPARESSQERTNWPLTV
jgi:hypothetical protein